MKSFLNVLYRRILYKIPLKWLLLGLAVFAVLLASFSSAGYTSLGGGNLSLGGRETRQNFGSDNSRVYGSDTLCIVNNGNVNCNFTICQHGNCATINDYRMVGCITGVVVNANEGPTATNNSSSSCSTYDLFLSTDLFYPQYTSLQCQTEYNLIPVESVDQNYCESNNLCPSCPVCPVCPVGTGGYSQLYINNILHLGAPNIIMNIPDEIDWDYAYTAGGQNMNIDVVGYNVDYEKIDSIVAFQNYKPSSEDFQKIIGLLAPYTKIIVFFVFLFIIWAWIKKPFKSKKL